MRSVQLLQGLLLKLSLTGVKDISSTAVKSHLSSMNVVFGQAKLLPFSR